MSVDNPKLVAAQKLGKAPLEEIPTEMWDGDAAVHALGADKYGTKNWRIDNIKASTYKAAMLRHLKKWWEGEDIDQESGYSHLYHIRACCAIVLDSQEYNTLIDDRRLAQSRDQATGLIETRTHVAPPGMKFESKWVLLADTPGPQAVRVADYAMTEDELRQYGGSLLKVGELRPEVTDDDVLVYTTGLGWANQAPTGPSAAPPIPEHERLGRAPGWYVRWVDPSPNAIAAFATVEGPFINVDTAQAHALQNPHNLTGIRSVFHVA